MWDLSIMIGSVPLAKGLQYIFYILFYTSQEKILVNEEI